MRVLLISDSFGFGILETRPYPVWQRKYTMLRNKALLSPDYGAMYVAAYLKERGIHFQVTNLIADLFSEPEFFLEQDISPPGEPRDPISYYQEESTPPIGNEGSLERLKRHFTTTLLKESPDIILLPISIYNLARHGTLFARRIKELLPDAILITGGTYATFHAEEILKENFVDFVVRGEGEETALELIQTIERAEHPREIPGLSYTESGRVIHNPDRKKIVNLDKLPHPYTVSDEFRIERRGSLLNQLNTQEDYIPGAGFLTARGCPERCTFCLDPAINDGRTRFHSPEYVYEVTRYCYETFCDGNSNFYFGDATFTLNRKRFLKMTDILQSIPFTYHIQTRADCLTPEIIRKLKESNFHSVAIGAETLNPRVLREVVWKNQAPEQVIDATMAVRKEGLLPLLTFIVGLPGESRDSIEKTLATLREHKITSASFFPLVVFKGTSLFERFMKEINPDDLESCRLNPYSEEFFYVSDEFPTPEALIDYTEELNVRVKEDEHGQ